MSTKPPASAASRDTFTGYVCAGTIVWDRNERRARRIRFLSRVLFGAWKR